MKLPIGISDFQELITGKEPAYYIDRCNNEDGTIQAIGYSEKENKVIVYGRIGYEIDPETG